MEPNATHVDIGDFACISLWPATSGGAAGARFGGAADSADPSLGAGAKSVADSDWEDYFRIVTVT